MLPAARKAVARRGPLLSRAQGWAQEDKAERIWAAMAAQLRTKEVAGVYRYPVELGAATESRDSSDEGAAEVLDAALDESLGNLQRAAEAAGEVARTADWAWAPGAGGGAGEPEGEQGAKVGSVPAGATVRAAEAIRRGEWLHEKSTDVLGIEEGELDGVDLDKFCFPEAREEMDATKFEEAVEKMLAKSCLRTAAARSR